MTPNATEALSLLAVLSSDLYTIHRDGGPPSYVKRPRDTVLGKYFEHCASHGLNVYFQGNTVAAGCTADKPSKADIVSLRALFIDLDPNPNSNWHSERQRLNEMLCPDALPPGVPPPSAIWFTGGGYQAAWILNEFLESTPENIAKYESLNKALQEQFPGAKGGGTFNIDRLLRVPGTVNVLSKKKLSEGREPALAVLEDLNDRRYTFGSFDFSGNVKSFSSQPAKESASTGNITADDINADIVVPEEGYLDKYEKLHPRIKWLINNGHPGSRLSEYEGMFGPVPDGRDPNNRNGWVYDVISNSIRAGVPDGDILGFLLDKRCGISAHIYDQADPEYAARRQVARGHNTVAKDEPKEKPTSTDDEDTVVPPLNEEPILDIHTEQDTNIPFKTPHNCRAFFQRLKLKLTHDQFADLTLLNGKPIQDSDINAARFAIEQQHGVMMPKEMFNDWVDDEARRHSFHPVKEYFEKLVWDGVPRLDTWLIKYGGAEDSDYTRAVGALPILAAVRRVYEPGAEFQEILTLVSSKQGTYKSTAIQTLCPNLEWFSDDLPLNAESREVIERLQGHLIIECAETKGMEKGSNEHVKAFLSRRVDKARMAYGHVTTRAPRQCVFIATSNDEKLLRDPTGNRRWWPVIIKCFNVDALAEDRDQIWAEAVIREKEMRPKKIKLHPSLYAAAGAVQDAHTEDHPFVDTLGRALDGKWGKILVADTWDLISTSSPRTHNGNSELGKAMKKLGWERSKQRMKGKDPQNCFMKGLAQADGSTMDAKQGRWIVSYKNKEGRVEALYLEDRPSDEEIDAF